MEDPPPFPPKSDAPNSQPDPLGPPPLASAGSLDVATSVEPPPPLSAAPADAPAPFGESPPPTEVPWDSLPPVIPPPVPPSPPAPTPEPFIFHGNAREYFRIWIVNTLLTLVTVGVFSAWAKVRKRRYLRGCTELLGHRFDYRARPARLLIGNLIVVTFFLAYSVFGVVYPPVRYGVIGLGVLLLPWIVVRSLAFNAHHTAYRGLRFRFHPSLSNSTMVYLLEPLLLVVTLGFYYPAWTRSKRSYVVANHRLGDAYFRFNAPVGVYYGAYVLGGIMFVAGVVIGTSIVTVTTVAHNGQPPGPWIMVLVFALYGLGFLVAKNFIHAWLFNHVWNHTTLDEHRFVATLSISRWLGLQLGNFAAIIATAGLLYPWAVIRTQRYTASCLHFIPSGPIECIQKLGGTTGSATGDTAAEFIGLDFGL